MCNEKGIIDSVFKKSWWLYFLMDVWKLLFCISETMTNRIYSYLGWTTRETKIDNNSHFLLSADSFIIKFLFVFAFISISHNYFAFTDGSVWFHLIVCKFMGRNTHTMSIAFCWIIEILSIFSLFPHFCSQSLLFAIGDRRATVLCQTVNY